AYDIYGKKTDSRAFSVDNTPPVFVCETLTSITDPSKNVFGHTISLKGEAKDSSEINKIYFDVFDDTKKLLSSSMDYKMTYEGIVIAQYSDTVPTDESKKILKENYDTIYGITQASPSFSDVKNFYLSFRLADEARIYNNPVYDSKTEVTGSGEGNISTELFLKTEDFDNSKLTAEKISDYKKHLSEDSTTEAELNKLKASSVAEVPSTNDNLSKTTRIQINPDIFPKWSVSSKEKPVTGDCPDLHAGSTFDIQFEKGNNKTEFRPSNIRVVLARLDDNGNPYATEDALKNQADSDANVIVLAKKGVMTTDMKEEFHESFKAEMKDNNGNDLIKTSTNYQIMVFGFDGSGTTENTGYEFKPKNTNGYGFRIIKAGAPAEVSFLAGDTTKQEYQNLPKNSNYMGPEVPVSGEQAIWFKVKTTNVELKDLPKVNVTMNGKDLLSEGYFDVVKKNENGVVANTLTDYQADNTTEGSDKYIYIFKWSLKKLKALPLTDEWNKEFEMKVAVTAQDKETSAVTANIMFNYDNKKPELKAGTPSPVVNVDNDSFINGTVLIPVEYSDGQGFATGTEATWEAVCSNENHNHSAVKGTVKNENSISLNTLQSSFTDGEAIKLKLSVKDKYGNVKEIFTPEYKILQSTDIPKIEFVNLYSGTEESKNNFGITMNSTIAAEVSDDDGVAKVRARAKKKTANWTKTTSDAFTDNTEWTDVEVRNSQITWDFKKANKITEDGQYTVQFAVKDIVGNLTNSTFVTGEYSIIADSTYPAFGTETVTNANTDNGMHYVKKNQSVEIKVPLTEVNLKTVKVDGTELTDANIKAHTAAGASDKVDWDITYTWNPGSETTGQKDVVFEAEDLSGNTSSYRVKLYYDAELPEITEFTVSPVYDESKTPSVVNGMLTLKWKVQDNTGKYDTTSPVKLSAKDKNNKEGIATASQTSSEGTIKLNTTKLSDNSAFADKGNIVFTVTVKDFAGNEKSQTFTYYLNQETDKPVITFNSDLIDETLLTHDDVENKTKNPNSKNMFSLNGNNILSGTVTDDDAVGSVEI
ncbi:MAG: hypothetical protein HUK25_01675, partial [Treponema sp.]|nr:hypothetical protein [Treponema sp.]